MAQLTLTPIDSAHRLKCPQCQEDQFFVASETEGPEFKGPVGLVECTKCHKEFRVEYPAEKVRVAIEAADKEALYSALYRLLEALYCARYETRNDDRIRANFHVAYLTADHWAPLIPGMPNYENVARMCRADDAHHERTRLGERLGVYLTGDEMM